MTSQGPVPDAIGAFEPQEGFVVTRTRYAPGYRSDWHSSDRAQLIYPSRGVMTLRTRGGAWVAPPLRGCWLPAFEEHQVETATGLEMHSVYCCGLAARLPDRCGVVSVSPLMRELILALAELPRDPPARTFAEKVDALLLHQIALQPQPPLFLPKVTAPALQQIATALLAEPADRRTLEAWSAHLGMSTRSLARLFEREAKMSFTEFRRQIRLHASIERLARGQSVTSVALDLGFSSAANFIAMFRRATGATPKAYFRAR